MGGRPCPCLITGISRKIFPVLLSPDMTTSLISSPPRDFVVSIHYRIYIPDKATTKYISSLIFLFTITMFDELCIPVRMRIVALGHPLDEARRLADAIMLQLVLLCMLLGFRMVRPDGEGRQVYRAVLRTRGVLSPGIRGILPAGAGTNGRSPAALLHS